MQKQIYTKENMQKHLDALPSEIKNLLYSTEIEMIIQKVGLDNRLHLDQVSMLMAVTNEVLTGFVSTEEYVQALMENLDIEKIKAESIAKSIDEALFSKIRDAMKKAYEQTTAAPTPTVSQPSAINAAPTLDEKSVVMPSSIAHTNTDGITAPKPTAPIAASASTAPVPSAVTPSASTPPAVQMTAPKVVPNITAPMHEADIMLSEATVSLPLAATGGQAKKFETVPNVTTKPEPAPSAAAGAPPPPAIHKVDPYREPIE